MAYGNFPFYSITLQISGMAESLLEQKEKPLIKIRMNYTYFGTVIIIFAFEAEKIIMTIPNLKPFTFPIASLQCQAPFGRQKRLKLEHTRAKTAES